MGNCFNVDATNKALEQQLAVEEQKESSTVKILFLGAGGGGKSTIFKQLGRIYNGKYDIPFDEELVKTIYTQITEQMQAALTIWNITSNKSYELDELNECIETVQNHKDLTTLPDNVANAIQYIWQNSIVLKESMNSMKFTHKILAQNCLYFWNELDRIKQQDYIPNQLDFLHLNHHTTGIVQRWLTVNDKKFHIFDVGGQVSERRKWISCFDNVTALLFVCSLACYNQTMFEDRNKNCMQDSMEIFEDICNDKIFAKSDIILFLNKKDLFAEKIKNIAITDCSVFNDFLECKNDEMIYNNKNDYEQCISYIRFKFNGMNHSNKVIYTHVTCAIEQNNIQKVFDDVRNIIVRQNAKEIVSNGNQ